MGSKSTIIYQYYHQLKLHLELLHQLKHKCQGLMIDGFYQILILKFKGIWEETTY
jgi:hypothetical protein